MHNHGPQHVLVTGAAGFIGFHTCERLLKDGHRVTGLDWLSGGEDLLAIDRLAALGISTTSPVHATTSRHYPAFTFLRADIRDFEALEQVFRTGITHVIHLAAQVGVRKSVNQPRAYLETNVDGFFNVLELSRQYAVRHLVFASSSSVYGLTTESPFREEQPTDRPASFYAATKKSNELFAHSYAHLHQVPVTGLRFFTVYGPWSRLDMAPYLFARNIVDGKPIRVFNHGNQRRDFTYVGDIVEGIARILGNPPAPEPAPFRIYNIGRGAPVDILEFIHEIELLTGKKAEIELVDRQPGDVDETYADVTGLREAFGYQPQTTLQDGLQAWWEWFHGYFGDGISE